MMNTYDSGQVLEVVLAKPQTEKKFDMSNPHNPMPHPNYIPHAGYGAFPVNPYGSVTSGYGATAGFQQVFARIPAPLFSSLPFMWLRLY